MNTERRSAPTGTEVLALGFAVTSAICTGEAIYTALSAKNQAANMSNFYREQRISELYAKAATFGGGAILATLASRHFSNTN